jgi:hypothetical protein
MEWFACSVSQFQAKRISLAPLHQVTSHGQGLIASSARLPFLMALNFETLHMFRYGLGHNWLHKFR